MRLLARKLSQHRDRPRHRFLGSQGLNYGWSNIFVNLCCSRIGASFDVAVALCQTMLSRLAPKASIFLSVFKGACVNLCCCQPSASSSVLMMTPWSPPPLAGLAPGSRSPQRFLGERASRSRMIANIPSCCHSPRPGEHCRAQLHGCVNAWLRCVAQPADRNSALPRDFRLRQSCASRG